MFLGMHTHAVTVCLDTMCSSVSTCVYVSWCAHTRVCSVRHVACSQMCTRVGHGHRSMSFYALIWSPTLSQAVIHACSPVWPSIFAHAYVLANIYPHTLAYLCMVTHVHVQAQCYLWLVLTPPFDPLLHLVSVPCPDLGLSCCLQAHEGPCSVKAPPHLWHPVNTQLRGPTG